MLYYVLTIPGGECITSEEKVMRNREGYVSATYVPEGGHVLPFNTLLAAFLHIRDRETKRWKTKTDVSIHKGAQHGYYVTAAHDTGPFDRGVKSSDRMRRAGKIVRYFVIPTPEFS